MAWMRDSMSWRLMVWVSMGSSGGGNGVLGASILMLRVLFCGRLKSIGLRWVARGWLWWGFWVGVVDRAEGFEGGDRGGGESFGSGYVHASIEFCDQFFDAFSCINIPNPNRFIKTPAHQPLAIGMES
jgi:hypothetical protein